MAENRFRCALCGQDHEGLPLSFAADYPDTYANMSADERDARAVISSDQCIIDNTDFYLRGCLEIPIVGSDEIFMWGLWARIHEADFDEIDSHWETEGRETLSGPYKGRLANALSIYTDTLSQKLEIRISPVGTGPLFVLQEPGSSLYDEQHSGLSGDKAAEYACLLMRMQRS